MTKAPVFLSLAAIVVLIAEAVAQQAVPPAPDPAVVESGTGVYRQYCSSCHGDQGQGAPDWQRPNAAGDLPAPPHDSTGHTWRHADGALYQLVMEGWRDPFNRTDRLTMPAFADVLAPTDVRAVLDFLKTLWTPDQRLSQFELSRTDPYPPEAR
ncbi:MAG: c-type cytochrome [Bauldia sp.]